MSANHVQGGPAPTGYLEAARALTTGRLPHHVLDDLLMPVRLRQDCSDRQLAILLKLLLTAGDDLSVEVRDDIAGAALSYRYWMDEPGRDSMCHWSESHQIMYSACEHLAGQHFSDHVFSNDGRRGTEKAERGRRRILDWLTNRFRHGSSEWLSGGYQLWSIVALCLVIEHTEDEDLRTRSSMVLDQMLLDLALHRFDGRLVASAGRSEALDKACPSRARINPVLDHFFRDQQPAFRLDDPVAIITSCSYRMPAVLQEIADASADRLIHVSQGLDVGEAIWDISRRRCLSPAQQRDELVHLLWSMEAFSLPDAIGPTIDAIRRWDMAANPFLGPMSPLAKLRSEKLMRAAISALNPISQGIALQRANVTTYRTPHYLLSSAQHYQPGGFGDQQHLWVAGLPGDITVFSTHPGTTTIGTETRPATPSAWVGNGVNPDIGQWRNVALVLHDLSGRAGHLEGRRHELSHLYFPLAKFDETSIGPDYVAGRRGDSFIAVAALGRIEATSEVEIVQRGRVTGWGVAVADRSEHSSLAHMVQHLRASRLSLEHDRLTWRTPEHRYEQRWRGDFTVDRKLVDSFHPRLSCDWGHVPRNPSIVQIEGDSGSLLLDWTMGERWT